MEERFNRNPRVEIAPLDQEAILFDPKSNKFLVLNSTSAFVWQRLSTGGTAQDLASALCESFQGVGLPEALDDVRQILGEMAAQGIVIGNLDHSTLSGGTAS